VQQSRLQSRPAHTTARLRTIQDSGMFQSTSLAVCLLAHLLLLTSFTGALALSAVIYTLSKNAPNLVRYSSRVPWTNFDKFW